MNIRKFKERLLADLNLVRSNYTWLKIGICVCQLAYFQTIVARKLAFYRHRPIGSYLEGPEGGDVRQHTLLDIGHQLAPDLGEERWIHTLNSKFLQVFSCFVAAVALLPYFLDQRSTEVCPYYSINMALRFLFVVCIGKFIRVFFFLPTSLPGSARHCFGEIEEEHRPKQITDIFVDHKFNGPYNCGDLLFSGHMLIVTSTLCYIWYYLTKLVSRRTALVTMGCCLMCALIQVTLIVLTRSHYSVDLTLGVTVGFCLWHTFSYVWCPEDRNPYAGRAGSFISDYVEVSSDDANQDGPSKHGDGERSPRPYEKDESIHSASSSDGDEFHQRNHAGKRDL
eukprot:gb/GECG01010588.1/.p1 GENE.gb/GECG01010588.1/~~gb/GECG01010588.1/.p1  ORF type:complete len:338 (+),score=23.12 gb/GECG01010588.1/:1-1014(+)